MCHDIFFFRLHFPLFRLCFAQFRHTPSLSRHTPSLSRHTPPHFSPLSYVRSYPRIWCISAQWLTMYSHLKYLVPLCAWLLLKIATAGWLLPREAQGRPSGPGVSRKHTPAVAQAYLSESHTGLVINQKNSKQMTTFFQVSPKFSE